MRHIESNLQIACFSWFSLQYPQLKGFLFHIPNGGFRGKQEAIRFKCMGVTPGVADLFLMIPSKGFHGLFIEMKTDNGKMSDYQQLFCSRCTGVGYKYAICRNLDQFMDEVLHYLK